MLSEYPAETIRYVTDPRTGIAANPLTDPETGRMWTGMPDLANVKRACERHYAPTRQLLERQRRMQQAEQQRLEDERIEQDRKTRPTYDELVARCAAKGIRIGSRGLPPTNPDQLRREFGVTKEEWDSIPDQPKRA